VPAADAPLTRFVNVTVSYSRSEDTISRVSADARQVGQVCVLDGHKQCQKAFGQVHAPTGPAQHRHDFALPSDLNFTIKDMAPHHV
jgi:hypothetical protein